MNIMQPIRKRLPLLLGFTAGLALLVGFLTFGKLGNALANSNDLANFEGQYPGAVGSAIDTCALCHASNIPALNPYGAAYKANGRSSAALAAIESVDSDGDGFSNIVEINAATFPGDPNSHPASSPTSTPTSVPTSSPTSVSTLPTGVLTATSTGKVTPTRPAGTPHPTKTPKTSKTPRVTKTPKPTGQPTPCVRGNDNSASSGNNASSRNHSGSPDDRHHYCQPSGGGDNRGGKGGGGEGGNAGGSQSLAPSNTIVAFLDSLFGIQ